MDSPGSGLPAQGATRRHLDRWQVAVAVPLALIGFLVVVQIRNVWDIRRALRIPSTQLEELGYMLREQERRRSALEAQVAELRSRLADYEKAAAEGRTAAVRANRQLQEMRALAGLTPLEGPGVVVHLDDNPHVPRPGEDPNKTILHYTDIAAVVGELWAAGAEAIAVNGERIIGRTGITCVGTTILCNTKRMAPPYVIVAIGDPRHLSEYLRRPGGAVDLLVSFAFPVKVTSAARIEVPPYRGTLGFEYAAASDKE
jgi:uncharacterized protein YlxW (UPF0749 family)